MFYDIAYYFGTKQILAYVSKKLKRKFKFVCDK